MVNTYEFTFVLKNIALDTSYEDTLFEAGCGDGLISLINGFLNIRFDREAISAEVAILSAIDNVIAMGAQVANINEAGHVSLSEAAYMAGITEDTLDKLKRESKGFPNPVQLGSTETWPWLSVVRWLYGIGQISKEKLEVAEFLYKLEVTKV